MEIKELCQLIQTVSKSNLSKFFYEENDIKISMSSKNFENLAESFTVPVGQPSGEANPVPLTTTEVSTARESLEQLASLNTDVQQEGREKGKSGHQITSPLVGVFYSAPSEEAEPFVKIGDQVKEGQVVAIIEAMKLMNEIECDCSGTVAEILVQNGQAVEYGQPLFRII